MKRKFTFLLFLCTFSLSTFAQTPLTTAVDFTVTDVHGEEHNLFEMLDAGKHVIVDFFYTTCGPCIASVPTMNESFEKYGCNKGDVFYIAIDQGDSDQEVLAYENEYGGLFPAASGIEGGGNQVNSEYGISYYPTIIMIAPDRSIVSQDIFPVTHENLDGTINGTAGIDENPDACALPTSIAELENSQLNSLRLYPNPVNRPMANLEFDLKESSEMTINIYDVTGQLLQTVFSGEQAAGLQNIPVNTNALSKGAYFIKVSIDGQENIGLRMMKTN